MESGKLREEGLGGRKMNVVAEVSCRKAVLGRNVHCELPIRGI